MRANATSSAMNSAISACLLYRRVAVPVAVPAVEVAEELVDGRAVGVVTGQRPPEDALGELRGQPADLGAQAAHRLLALRRQLLRAAAVDLRDLAVGVGLHVVADLLGLGPGL